MNTQKILIVDDEEPNLKVLISWLVSLGYDIDTAYNGREALQKVRDYRPDLIILDIVMPVMDGYEACKRIKAGPETANTPIIMVTALHDRESKFEGLEAGANEFLSKPIDRAELTIRVKNLLAIKASEDFMLRHNQILAEEVRKRTLELDDAFRELENMSNEMV
ncbi:MAG: response regulator, partial [Nitrospira sp.]|nr:response regulator [Nitrospira sp.]